MAPLLLLLSNKNTLQPLYRALLPKLHINRNFLSIMIICYLVAGGLGLGSLEVEQTIEAINLVISLFDSLTPLSFLLKESL